MAKKSDTKKIAISLRSIKSKKKEKNPMPNNTTFVPDLLVNLDKVVEAFDPGGDPDKKKLKANAEKSLKTLHEMFGRATYGTFAAAGDCEGTGAPR